MKNKLQEKMTKIIMTFFAVFFLTAGIGLAAEGEWTWMSGSDIGEQLGTYGIKGTADLDNIPGARYSSISWTGDNGTLWLFGGHGYDSASFGFLNDLWRYEPDTNMWTWISGENEVFPVGIYGTKGTPHKDNIPGSRRSSISWTDSAGNLWLFGGEGKGTSASYNGSLNDLWRYDPGTKMWTWISGDNELNQRGVYGDKGTPHSDNIPGARHNSISWTGDNGTLWLFGGYGYDSGDYGSHGRLNDLWRYEPDRGDNGTWTWMSGDNETYQLGTYGIKGTADLDNIPGARRQSISWIDDGKLWLFGGYGEGSERSGYLNDLWRYNPDTNMWTWISGDGEVGQVGTFGTKGTPHMDNIPSTRRSSISWIDSAGKFWLFGGDGYDNGASSGSSGYLNDLWRYDPDTNTWTWISGELEKNQAGTYGTKGTADLDNIPSTRSFSISWRDSNGDFWLFGGNGIDGEGANLRLNDLWRYELPALLDCMVDADCPDGTCEYGFCVDYECMDDDDCPDGTCVSNVCVEYECIDDADCTDGECVENVCIDYECMDDADCPNGVCTADNICVECEDDLDCADREICEANLCEDACPYPPKVNDFDLDGNCLLSKEELKVAKTFYKDKHKAEKDALKASQGVDKAFLKSQKDILSKEELKAAKTFYKDKHKTEKGALKASQGVDKAFLKSLKEYAE